MAFHSFKISVASASEFRSPIIFFCQLYKSTYFNVTFLKMYENKLAASKVGEVEADKMVISHACSFFPLMMVRKLKFTPILLVIEFWLFIPELNRRYFPYSFHLNDFCSNKCLCMLIKEFWWLYGDTTYMNGDWLPVGQFDFSLSQNISNAQNFKPPYLTTKWVANILC